MKTRRKHNADRPNMLTAESRRPDAQNPSSKSAEKAPLPRWGGVILFFIFAAVLYFSSLHLISLTDPDEVFYSMTARDMLAQHSYVTPVLFGHPQFEKPPLFYWLLIGAFKIFGVGEFAARLIPAVCGFLGIVATFFFCRRVFDRTMAILTSLLLATAALYLAMSKAVLTDITLSVLITMALYAFYLWFTERREIYLYGFAVASALAVLTKGPVGAIIPVVTAAIFLAAVKDYAALAKFFLHPWVFVFCLVCVPWYAVILAKHGGAFVDEFIIRDNWDRILYAEHKSFDRWYFYPMIMTAGLFPWTFYLALMGRVRRMFRQEAVFLWVWVLVTFVLFQRAHSKLASYILPLLPAWVMLLSLSISAWTHRSKRVMIVAVAYGVLGMGLLVAPSLIPAKYAAFVWPQATIGVRVLGAALIAGAVLVWRARLMQAVAVQAAGLTVMFLLVAMQIPPSIDRMVAGKYLTPVVEQEHYEGEVIVTNKLYARGLHFHTGNPVVILDHNKQPFWSPHPIEVLSTPEEIRRFFDTRLRVLCVIKKSYLEELNNLFAGRRTQRIISTDGPKIVVMSEKVAN